jgi:hypothetical protein
VVVAQVASQPTLVVQAGAVQAQWSYIQTSVLAAPSTLSSVRVPQRKTPTTKVDLVPHQALVHS